MNLNLYILKRVLSQLSPKAWIHHEPTHYPCAYPLLYSPGMAFQADAVYIAEASRLPMQPDPGTTGCIVCMGVPPDAYRSKNWNVLYIEVETDPAVVLGEVVAAFHRFNQLERKLHGLALNGADMEAFGQAMRSFFSNPFSFESVNFRKLFHFPGQPPTPMTAKYQAYLDNVFYDDSAYTTPEETSFLLNDPEFLRAQDYAKPMIYSGDHYGFRTLYYNIHIRGAYVARILVDEVVCSLDEYDFAVIKLLGDLLSLGIRSQEEEEFIQSQEMAAVLQGLLSHRYLPEHQIRTALDLYRWRVDDPYFCLLVSMHSCNQGVVYRLAQQLERVAPQLCYITLPDEAVFVIHLTNEKQNLENVFSRMIPILRDFMLLASVSTVFDDFKDLYYHYLMARFAFHKGQEKHPTFWYFRTEDYLLDYFLHRCQYSRPTYALLHPSVQRLMDHDKKKNSRYTNLLRTYLACNQSIVETIRREHIHRTTFLYQLDRIKEIINLDLDDPDICLMLQLCLKLSEGLE